MVSQIYTIKLKKSFQANTKIIRRAKLKDYTGYDDIVKLNKMVNVYMCECSARDMKKILCNPKVVPLNTSGSNDPYLIRFNPALLNGKIVKAGECGVCGKVYYTD